MSDLGLSGYASLMRQQKNPYDRNMVATTAVMNQLPKDGGYTGLEGIGKIPLMFAMGQDAAAAKGWDEELAAKEDTYMGNVLKMEQEKTAAEAAQHAMKNWLELGKTDPAAANALADNSPVLQSALPSNVRLKDKITKDGWLTVEGFTPDGESKVVYQLNLGGMEAAKAKLAEQGVIGTPSVHQLAAAMPTGYSFKLEGAAKAAPDSKYTLHDGYGQGQHATYKLDNRTGQTAVVGTAPIREGGGNGSGGGDAKEFRQWTAKLDGLKKSRASVEKGFDPFTGQPIESQTQIAAALRTIDAQIMDNESYISQSFPDQWRTYKKAANETKPAPAGPAPGKITGTKTIGNRTFIRDSAGNWFEEQLP